MHVTFLDPFLWYQLLKLVVDRSSSPCLPNCILFFDNSEHPHQSLLLLQSHWLMALPARQNKSQQQGKSLCVAGEKQEEIKGNGTTEQHTTRTPPLILHLVTTLRRHKSRCTFPLSSSAVAVRFKYSTLFRWHSNDLFTLNSEYLSENKTENKPILCQMTYRVNISSSGKVKLNPEQE